MAVIKGILCTLGFHKYQHTRFTVFGLGTGGRIQFRTRKTCKRCGKTLIGR